MNITVTFIDPEKNLHVVEVPNVADVDQGKQRASAHMEWVCQDNGWNFSEFRMHSVVVVKSFKQYITTWFDDLFAKPRD